MRPHSPGEGFTAVQVVASLNADTGGPALSVSRLASSLQRLGIDSRVVTLDYAEHGPQLPVGDATLVSVAAGPMARRLRGFSPLLLRSMGEAARGAKVVHSHGLWMDPNRYAARVARNCNASFVVSPRGMLEPWALERGRLKKSLTWRLWQRRGVEDAALLHATSVAEAESLRRLGLCQPVAILPNGVDLPERPGPPRSSLEARFGALAGKRWMLFMSRLHRKKGVSELLEAWRRVQAESWHLILAGPDLDGFGQAVARDIERLGLGARVTCTGMLRDDLKECALAHAEVFVLPTRSENFGVAIAEALAREVPVITTRAAPWDALVTEACGWWIDLDPASLERAMREAIAADPARLREMGARGRRLVERRFAWERIAGGMKEAYMWLQGQGPRPEFVDPGRAAAALPA